MFLALNNHFRKDFFFFFSRNAFLKLSLIMSQAGEHIFCWGNLTHHFSSTSFIGATSPIIICTTWHNVSCQGAEGRVVMWARSALLQLGYYRGHRPPSCWSLRREETVEEQPSSLCSAPSIARHLWHPCLANITTSWPLLVVWMPKERWWWGTRGAAAGGLSPSSIIGASC